MRHFALFERKLRLEDVAFSTPELVVELGVLQQGILHVELRLVVPLELQQRAALVALDGHVEPLELGVEEPGGELELRRLARGDIPKLQQLRDGPLVGQDVLLLQRSAFL